MKRLMPIAPMVVFCLCLAISAQAGPSPEFLATIKDDEPNPLPRYATEQERLIPLRPADLRDYMMMAPPPGLVHCVAEYEPMQGAVVRWGTFNALLTEFIVGFAQPGTGLTAWVIVNSSSQQSSAAATLSAAGANMSQVQFIIAATNSVCIRDYGPRYVFQDNTKAVVDHVYNRPRPYDDVIPNLLAQMWYEPIYDLPLLHGGGNFHLLATGAGFTSTLILDENPALTQTQVADFYREYQNIDPLVVYQRLPAGIDATGHIDMWACPVSDTEFIVAEFPSGDPNYLGYTLTEAAAADLVSRGYTVYRVPGLNSGPGGYNGTHYTYTNSVILNDRVFLPYYGGVHSGRDAQALAVWQAAMPNHTIIPVNCAEIIPFGGAVHCVMMHVPAYTQAAPSVKVLSPDGGEVWGAGHVREITWAANDDLAVTSVDLYYSTDGGATFPFVIATGEAHDGRYTWTVPGTMSENCRVRIVVHDGNANSGQDLSDADFTITRVKRQVYDFGTSAGVDRWAYGSYSDSWIEDLEANRTPPECMTEVTAIDPGAYARLAASDATAPSPDPNRYTNPQPLAGDESTLRAEFTIRENPDNIVGLEALWEGYGAGAAHTELYIWDDVAGNWSDGAGRVGDNRYIDAYRAYADYVLSGQIKSGFDNYINGADLLTLLVYCDSFLSGVPSYHDYVQVVVYSLSIGDFDGDGDVDLADFVTFQLCFGGSGNPPATTCPPGVDADLDGDGDVDLADFLIFQQNFTGSQ